MTPGTSSQEEANGGGPAGKTVVTSDLSVKSLRQYFADAALSSVIQMPEKKKEKKRKKEEKKAKEEQDKVPVEPPDPLVITPGTVYFNVRQRKQVQTVEVKVENLSEYNYSLKVGYLFLFLCVICYMCKQLAHNDTERQRLLGRLHL